MSKKAFLIILVLSVVVWYISRFIQSYTAYFFNNGGFSFGSGCAATGLPVALCINEYDSSKYGYYLLNIGLWFVIFSVIRKVSRKVTGK